MWCTGLESCSFWLELSISLTELLAIYMSDTIRIVSRSSSAESAIDEGRIWYRT